jgi:SulP family sulfate permease
MRSTGIVVLFSGLKKQVLDVMQATGLLAMIGEKSFFPTAEAALAKIYSREENLEADDSLRPAAVAGLMREQRFS